MERGAREGGVRPRPLAGYKPSRTAPGFSWRCWLGSGHVASWLGLTLLIALLMCGCRGPSGPPRETGPSSPPPRPTPAVATPSPLAVSLPTPAAANQPALLPGWTPSPTALPAIGTRFSHLWLADGETGWLSGSRCQASPPRDSDSVATPVQTICQGLIVGTTDGGKSWSEEYRGDVAVGQIQFVGVQTGWSIGSPGAACADGDCASTLLRTIDGGQHWTPAYTAPLRLTDLAFTSSQQGWLLGESCAPGQDWPDCPSHLLTTSDGGQSWLDAIVSLQGYALDIEHPTTTAGWFVATNDGPGGAQIIATHDGGQTWGALADPDSSVDWSQRLYFRSATQGWLIAAGEPAAAAQMKEVYGTNDGGHTWTKLAWTGQPNGTLPLGGYVGPMVFPTAQEGWIASARGGLLHSADGGKAWNAATVSDRGFLDVRFASPKDGWALSLGSLWTTLDGGTSWQRLPLPTGAA